MARRLLPVTLGAPVVLAWLELQGQRAGLYGPVFGMALYATALGVICSLVVLRSGGLLRLSAQAHARLEAALHDSEARYRRLTDNAYDLIAEMRLDEPLQLLYVSPNHQDVLGYDPSELVGQSVLDFVHPSDVAGVLAALGQEHGQATFRARHRHGEWRWFEGTGKAFHTASGERRSVIISRDVTARKQAEEQRAALEEKLRRMQRLDAVGRLASGIAHDFNNQLTVIKGSTQFLLAALPAEDPRRRDAERISATVDRGAQLVSQLLAAGRQQPIAPRSLDLTQLMTEMMPMLRVLLGNRIALQPEIDPTLWHVRADPGQIERVIMNLVANAKDALLEAHNSGRAPTVTVRATNVERSAVAAAPVSPTLRQGEYVLLAVSDTGAGMSSEVRQHIFEPYFTTKPFAGGTGLGLYTACGIVEQHGGSITCHSQPGHGTTFTIHLPRETGAAAAARAAALDQDRSVDPPAVGTPPALHPAGATVLVAEDEEHLRELIRETLEHAGYRVHVAGDTDAALAVAVQLAAPIDVLVTDIAMPGSSGCALARRLTQAHPAVKVLLISGYYLGGWVDANGVPGARFLPKPFDVHVLLQHVRELLEGQAPPGTSVA